jgi:hypothetical protein
VSHVGASRDQRSSGLPSPHAQERRLFRRCAIARWQFLFRRETGRFNGESFWEFLKVFKEASTVNGRRVLAISDNAQYHRSQLHLNWRLQQAPEFGLDFLPP